VIAQPDGIKSLPVGQPGFLEDSVDAPFGV
jgi:hypothetical protein